MSLNFPSVVGFAVALAAGMSVAKADYSEAVLAMRCDKSRDDIVIATYIVRNGVQSTKAPEHWAPAVRNPLVQAVALDASHGWQSLRCKTNVRSVEVRTNSGAIWLYQEGAEVAYKVVGQPWIDGTIEYRLRSNRGMKWEECIARNPNESETPPPLKCGPITDSKHVDPDEIEKRWKVGESRRLTIRSSGP